jgi:hypothetical protein
MTRGELPSDVLHSFIYVAPQRNGTPAVGFFTRWAGVVIRVFRLNCQPLHQEKIAD